MFGDDNWATNTSTVRQHAPEGTTVFISESIVADELSRGNSNTTIWACGELAL
jgi:hypothetical protein